ncbi:NAD(P)H-dependent oxidoreductase [Kineococcus auxinigenes]|uniref:NAD(P)H-dependent oxidoreductase n=1 Tax=unclassified Kineococcus TaxID=2621656 RepID=UPI003D7EB57F
MTDVLVLVGSLRAASVNRKIAEAAVQLAPEGARLSVYEGLGDLPFYNEDVDVEGSVPPAATALREAVAAADAVLVVTPEHNGTIPAVLKNAVDWASRPYGASSLSGKPLAVVGSAFGQYGGVWAQDDARKVFGIAGAKVLAEATMAIPASVVRFAELHPKDDTEVTEKLTTVLQALVGATEPAAA